MTIEEEVQQLIRVSNQESNATVMRLMMTQQGLSFSEAFACLKFSLVDARQLMLYLSSISIQYTYDHYIMLDYYYVQREVFVHQKKQAALTKDIYEDTTSYGGIPGLDLVSLPEIVEDRKTISAAIEGLYFEGLKEK